MNQELNLLKCFFEEVCPLYEIMIKRIPGFEEQRRI